MTTEVVSDATGTPVPTAVEPWWHYGWMIPLGVAAGWCAARAVFGFVATLHGSVL